MNIKSLYSWAFSRTLGEMAADELRQARFDLMQCETALENNLACKDMLEGRIVRLEAALKPSREAPVPNIVGPVESAFRFTNCTSEYNAAAAKNIFGSAP